MGKWRLGRFALKICKSHHSQYNRTERKKLTMTNKEQLKKALSIIKKSKLLNQTSWRVIKDCENVQCIYLCPNKSVFSQEIEDTCEDGYFQSLNIHYHKCTIHMNRGYLGSIVFHFIDDFMNFIKEINLDVDLSTYEEDIVVSLSCYKRTVEILEKYLKEVKKYKKGNKNG